MWPSGKARVCKALYGGSNPPVTSQAELVFGKQSLEGVYVYTPLYLFWTLSQMKKIVKKKKGKRF